MEAHRCPVFESVRSHVFETARRQIEVECLESGVVLASGQIPLDNEYFQTSGATLAICLQPYRVQTNPEIQNAIATGRR